MMPDLEEADVVQAQLGEPGDVLAAVVDDSMAGEEADEPGAAPRGSGFDLFEVVEHRVSVEPLGELGVGREEVGAEDERLPVGLVGHASDQAGRLAEVLERVHEGVGDVEEDGAVAVPGRVDHEHGGDGDR